MPDGGQARSAGGVPLVEELRERPVEPLNVLLGPNPYKEHQGTADLSVAGANTVPQRGHLFDEFPVLGGMQRQPREIAGPHQVFLVSEVAPEGFQQLRQAQFEIGPGGAGVHGGCVVVHQDYQHPMLVVDMWHGQKEMVTRHWLRHFALPRVGVQPRLSR